MIKKADVQEGFFYIVNKEYSYYSISGITSSEPVIKEVYPKAYKRMGMAERQLKCLGYKRIEDNETYNQITDSMDCKGWTVMSAWALQRQLRD